MYMDYVMQKYSEKCCDVNDIRVTIECGTPEGPQTESCIWNTSCGSHREDVVDVSNKERVGRAFIEGVSRYTRQETGGSEPSRK